MAEEGRIERWRIRTFQVVGSGDNRHGLPDEIDGPDTGPEPVTVIPESAHSSEIERLAGELEARAERWSVEALNPNKPTTDPRRLGCAKGHEIAASLLRDSLTRGERGEPRTQQTSQTSSASPAGSSRETEER